MGLFGNHDSGKDIAILGRVGSRGGRDAPVIASTPVDEDEENRIMREDD